MTTSSGESHRDVYRRYVAATSEGPPNRLFDLVDPYLPKQGHAIDLGCGTGRGTLRLLSRGLQVTAVDRESEGLDVLRSKLPPDAEVRIIQSPFEDLALESYDVVVACYSLFFLSPDVFAQFWPRVVEAVFPGGIFAGEFLGPNDDWRQRGYTVLPENEVRQLFQDFRLLYFEEEDRDGDTATGVRKHWHVFHLIARKR